MIQSIEIKNFQSHKHTKVDFTGGVNVIIGTSDSGKTAILRALRWVVWNRPLGDSFRSHWGGDTSVTLTTDAYTVTRFKGKEDYYELAPKDEPMNATVFKAFGTSTPDEILDALNLSELNIQNQMDGPFLLSENPGEVSRHFNKIANIDAIDSSLRAVESWIRSLNQDIKTVDAEIEQLEETLENFQYLDKMEAEVESLEQMEGQLNQWLSTVKNIEKTLSDIESIDEQLEELDKLTSLDELTNELIEYHERKTEQIENYKSLKALCLSIVDCNNEIKSRSVLVNSEKLVNDVVDLYEKKRKVVERYNLLNHLLEKEQETDTALLEAEGILEDLENEWHENVPDICPLCEQEIP